LQESIRATVLLISIARVNFGLEFAFFIDPVEIATFVEALLFDLFPGSFNSLEMFVVTGP
jgi:hypothetical protein